MAESNRRDDDAADDRLNDETTDDVTDDGDADESVSRGDAAAGSKSRAESTDDRSKAKADGRVGIFGRLARFFREIVAELRKVIWPTRKELLTYTAVVVVFVSVVTAIVVGLDYVFAQGALWVFGNPS